MHAYDLGSGCDVGTEENVRRREKHGVSAHRNHREDSVEGGGQRAAVCYHIYILAANPKR